MFARRMQQLVACLAVWLAVAAGAAAEGTATNADLARQMRVVWTKTILDTYDATADADAPWHADARAFIEAYIDRAGNFYPVVLVPHDLAGIERMGRELLAAGCNEPIIQVLYGRILFAQGMVGEALPYLRSGYESCRATPNLQLLAGATAVRLAKCMTALGRDDQAADYYLQALPAIAAAAGNTMYGEDDQSALLEIIQYYCFDDLSVDLKGQLVTACVDQPDSREWLCKMLAGLRHLDVVAKSRQGLLRRSNEYGPDRSGIEAERLFTAAWRLRPERPQAAASMVRLTVYMPHSASAKEWFDLAVAAQEDYAPAHMAYIDYALAAGRWQVQDLLRTYGSTRLRGNYETLEPYFYFLAVTRGAHTEDRYYGYEPSPPPLLDDSSVRLNFKKMLKGYGRAELSGELLTHVRLLGAAVSCLSQDWPQAREYLDAVEDLPDHMTHAARLFEMVDLNAHKEIAQAYAKTGPAADALAQAMQEYGEGNYDAALAILFDAVEAHRDDYWTTAYLHHSIRYTLTTRDLAAGAWVDITPDTDLTGWLIEAGQAWVDADGQIVCLAAPPSRSSATWARLMCDRPLGGDAYELRTRVAFGGWPVQSVSAGPIIGSYVNRGNRLYYAATLSPDGGVDLMQRDYAQVRTEAQATSENTICVQVWKQNIAVFLNGESAIDTLVDDMPSERDASKAEVGVGGKQTSWSYADTPSGRIAFPRPMLFSDVQIRRLASPPAKGEIDSDYSAPLRISTYSPAYGDPRIGPLPIPAEPNDADGEDDPDAPAESHDETTPDDDVLLDIMAAISAEDDPATTIEKLEKLLEDETLSEADRQLVEQYIEAAPQVRADESADDEATDEEAETPVDDDGADDDQDAPAEPQDETAPDDDDEASLDKAITALSSEMMADVIVDLEATLELEDGTTIELEGELDPQELAALFALLKETSPEEDPAAVIERLEELLEDETLSEGFRQLAEQLLEMMEQVQDAELQVGPPDETNEAQTTQQVWTCSMHPHVELAEAGNCPICGMTLISFEVDQTDLPADDDAPSEDDEAPASQLTDDGRPSTDDEDAEDDPDERLAVIARRRAVAARLQEITRAMEAYADARLVVEDSTLVVEDLDSIFIVPSAPGQPADGDAPADEPDAGEVSPPVIGPVEPVVDDSLFRTELIGGEGGEAFEDTLRGPGYLVGVRLRFVRGGGQINSIQPIYLTPGGRRYGGRAGLGDGRAVDVVARDGYAVGDITCSAADSPGGLQLGFMRVTPSGQLDPADGYRSQWHGPGEGQSSAGTDGRLAVGLAGRMGDTLQALGLVSIDEPFMAGLDIPTGDLGPAARLVPPAPRPQVPAEHVEDSDGQDDSLTEAAPDEPDLADAISFEGHWYMAFYEPVTWQAAQDKCQALGGHLIYIDDEVEDDFAKLFVTEGSPVLWIGATDAAEEGHWVWADGSEMAYTNWNPDEPNDYGQAEDAAVLDVAYAYGWNDLPADTPCGFLCEWDRDPTAPDEAAPQQENDHE